MRSTGSFLLRTAVVAVLLPLLLQWAAPVAVATTNEADKQILLELKVSLADPQLLYSWDEATDPCDSWDAVGCDGDRVTIVDLPPLKTMDTGNITASIGGLTCLERFAISKSPNVTGPIPAEICKLVRLSQLHLQGNGLTGPIPDCIGELGSLVYLSLAQNTLSGEIPSGVGSLYNLRQLYLDVNQLAGPLPDSLANLVALERVNISNNQLTGDPSAIIASWTCAVVIDISHNNFSFDLGALKFPTGVTIYSMKGNTIFGTIPGSADGMERLKRFDVSDNNLCGRIPQGGVVNRLPASSFSGNTCLCGRPLASCRVANCALSCVGLPSARGLVGAQASRRRNGWGAARM